jgi:hypothetical protein
MIGVERNAKHRRKHCSSSGVSNCRACGLLEQPHAPKLLSARIENGSIAGRNSVMRIVLWQSTDAQSI